MYICSIKTNKQKKKKRKKKRGGQKCVGLSIHIKKNPSCICRLQLTSPLSLLSLSPMAAAKKERKRGKRRSFLCSFAACFGISNKVSADHSDRKSLSGRHSRPAPPPVNDQYTAAPPPEILKSREIDVVEQDEEEKKIASPSPDQLITTNKVTNHLLIYHNSHKINHICKNFRCAKTETN